MNLSALLFVSFFVVSNGYPFPYKFPSKRNFTEVFSALDKYNSTTSTVIDIRNKKFNTYDEIVTDFNLFHFMLNI